MDTIERIHEFLIAAGMTPAGAAGMMGNIQAESCFVANNAEDHRSQYSDEDYTKLVDCGIYGDERFATDAIGYGYVQLTENSRKRKYIGFVRGRGCSIASHDAQMDFLIWELKNDFPGVWRVCCTTEDVKEASDIVMRVFENPYDQSAGALAYRANLGMKIYERFQGTQAQENQGTTAEENPGTVYGRVYAIQPHQLGYNCKGPEVEALQLLLRAWGNDPGEPDGIFGAQTREAVQAFQRAVGLTDDGMVGHDTMSKLLGII